MDKSFEENMIETEQSGLAYKDMNSCQYYTATLIYYAAILSGGIFIRSLGLIFNFVGTFVGPGLSFIIPGMLYIYANRTYPENRDNKEGKLGVIGGNPKSNKVLLITAWIQVVSGIIGFFVLMYNSVHAIIN